MKIVKLTNQFNAKKKHGFEIGIKFTSYWDDGSAVERACADVLGKYSYFKEKHQRTWYSKIGLKRDPKTEMYPFWIYLKKESYLTAVLLSLKGD